MVDDTQAGDDDLALARQQLREAFPVPPSDEEDLLYAILFLLDLDWSSRVVASVVGEWLDIPDAVVGNMAAMSFHRRRPGDALLALVAERLLKFGVIESANEEIWHDTRRIT